MLRLMLPLLQPLNLQSKVQFIWNNNTSGFHKCHTVDIYS